MLQSYISDITDEATVENAPYSMEINIDNKKPRQDTQIGNCGPAEPVLSHLLCCLPDELLEHIFSYVPSNGGAAYIELIQTEWIGY